MAIIENIAVIIMHQLSMHIQLHFLTQIEINNSNTELEMALTCRDCFESSKVDVVLVLHRIIYL